MNPLGRKFLLALQVFVQALILLILSHVNKAVIYLTGDQFAVVFIAVVVAHLVGMGIQTWKFGKILSANQQIMLYDFRQRLKNLLSPGFLIGSILVWGIFFLFLKMPDVIQFGSWWTMTLAVLGMYEIANPIAKDLSKRAFPKPEMDNEDQE